MLRVGHLQESIHFYTQKLGMRLQRQETYPEGRFTLAFVGFGDEPSSAVLELTENWDRATYEHGCAFGHIALEVADVACECERLAGLGVTVLRAPGPMAFKSPERTVDETIAFIEDPDGYRIELVQTAKPSLRQSTSDDCTTGVGVHHHASL